MARATAKAVFKFRRPIFFTFKIFTS